MNEVEVFAWNPRRRRFGGRLGGRIPLEAPLNNFGDLLGPLIVSAMAAECSRDQRRPLASGQLLSVGSVLHLAQDGAVIWGSGVNGKIPQSEHRAVNLDIRAVRGPLTRSFLAEAGQDAPEVYGDPALLLGALCPRLKHHRKTRRYLVVNNLWDTVPLKHRARAVSPRRGVQPCVARIASAELVVGTSLHGLVVAEALGIPARAVLSESEPPFKYDDYYRGTGRPDWNAAPTIDVALALGGEPSPNWDPEPLVAAFPAELWATLGSGQAGAAG